jgi:hypothetical protein
MRITCEGAKAYVTEVEVMASGAINYFTASFTFDSAWTDFISANKLYGVFQGSNNTILTTLVYNNGTETYDCDVPWETITQPGELLVGAIGYIDGAEDTILTTNMAFGYRVPQGAATNAVEGSQASGLLLDVLIAVDEVEEDANRAEAAADAAELALTRWPYIDGPTNHWFRWDAGTELYVDTGVNATGPAAGFGTPTASIVQGLEGTQPQIAIFATGPDTAKVFDFDFTIPKGDTGDAAEIIINSTTTGAPGTAASVTNIGDTHTAILDFLIPQGIQGNTGAAAGFGTPTGSATIGAAGSQPQITISSSGPNTAKIFDFDFTIPKGDKGDAATIAVGTTTTGAAGTSASVTNSGNSSAAVFNFTIPKGDKGDTGKGFTIMGYYNTLVDLQNAHPTGTTGDAYGVGTGAPYNIYIWDGSAWLDNGQLQGPEGEQGQIGSQWYTGTAITGTSIIDTIFPTTGITEAYERDLYLNTDTNNVYQCTANGTPTVATWIYICNIKGDTGADFQNLTGASAPTTSTVGAIGQGYLDTTTERYYLCVSITGGTTYNWIEVPTVETITTISIVRW